MRQTMIGGTRWATCAFFALLIALLGLSAAYSAEALADEFSVSPTAATEGFDEAPCIPGQAIACVASGSETRLAQAFDSVEFLFALDDQASGYGPCDIVLVKSSSLTVEELIASLEACEYVVFAEPNYLEELQAEDGADPQTGTSLAAGSDVATRPDYTSKQYAFDGEFGIGVPDWDTYDSSGNPTPSISTEGKVVAVIDMGVDYNHEDLRNVMWCEGENYPALVALGGGAHGINVAPPRGDGTSYDTTDPVDDSGHGTHVAGIIAGEWNQFGVSGATSGAKIMAVKVMNDRGAMGMSEAIRAYRYIVTALQAGVDVVAINNSWGDDIYCKSLDMAIREAGRLGAVTVFAAGNERRNTDMVGQMSSAFFNNPYVVVVGSSDKNGQMSESSSFGKRSVDVFAPGQAVYSTILTGTGPGDDAADPLVADGVTFACDYESTVVQHNADDGVFRFTGNEGTQLAIADEGHNSSAHSLSLTGIVEETLSVFMTSNALEAGSSCRGLCLWLKAPSAQTTRLMITYNKVDGTTEGSIVDLTQASDDWRLVTLPIGSLADKDYLELMISITVFEWTDSPDPTILIDDVKLTSDTIPYEYDNGTSMASPAVTGAAAVLAVAYPDDDAARRAARIIGSVKPVGSLANQCVSGGIFRLDKALDQDTNPVLNEASTEADAVTIEGFFFGGTPGSLSSDGQGLTVLSWSDTEIVAQLPSGFSPGEKLVEVTTSTGKAGHQYFRIDTPTSLYQRLPLPGRSLSGDPGDYEVTSSEFDESFYGAIPRALVGLDGSLYYLLETLDGQGKFFRYDIDAQTWEQVYESDYVPGGGACTWDGKILFVAGQPRENSTYLGLFDPTTCTAEYHLTTDIFFERECTLVNTGEGILLAGGRRFRYGSTRQPAIEIVRTVDPESFAVTPITLPEGVFLYDSWYGGAYDEEGNGYLLCGSNMSGFYKFAFVDGDVVCTVLVNGPVLDNKNSDAQYALSASADGTPAVSQPKNMVAGPTKSGIIASGPVLTDDADVVTADTYTVSWGDTNFEETDKQMSVTKMFNAQGTTYRGQFYVIAASESEVGDHVFASVPIETFEQPGDVPESAEPIDPDDPIDPIVPDDPDDPDDQSNPDDPDDQPVTPDPPDQTDPSNPSESQESSESKIPTTGDPLSTAAPFLMTLSVVCLIASCASARRVSASKKHSE